jgi:anti-sigma28 factor (negative regulator of flagellin synthesis)
MKLPKISQYGFNTIFLVGIGITFLLAALAYWNKTKNTEGLVSGSDWELTTDGDGVALQYKADNTFKVTEDGTIENSTIDELKKKIEELEKKVDAKAGAGEEGKAGTAGTAGEAGKVGEKGEKGDPGEAGKVGEKGDPGEKGDKGDKGSTGSTGSTGSQGVAGAVPNMSSYVKKNGQKHFMCGGPYVTSGWVKFVDNNRSGNAAGTAGNCAPGSWWLK